MCRTRTTTSRASCTRQTRQASSGWSSRRGGRTITTSVDDLATKQRSATITVPMPAPPNPLQLPVYVFHRPRAGKMHMFWDLTAMYKVLGFSAFLGVPSRWLATSPRWVEFFKGATGESHLVYSTFTSKNCSARQDLPFSERCLPGTSASTQGLLLQLARWAFASRPQGGCSKKQDRDACKKMFVQLLAFLLEGGFSFSITLEVVDKWRSRWPRPEPLHDGVSVLELRVTRGIVDRKPLLQLFESKQGGRMVRSWCLGLAECFHIQKHRFALATLVEETVSRKALAGFWPQLVAAAARELERKLSAATRIGKPLSCLSMQWNDLATKGLSQYEFEKRLVQYMESSRDKAMGHTVVGYCTDKATIAGLSLQVTIAVTPEGVAIVCRPQAGFREGGLLLTCQGPCIGDFL